jgi:hypothetical protein
MRRGARSCLAAGLAARGSASDFGFGNSDLEAAGGRVLAGQNRILRDGMMDIGTEGEISAPQIEKVRAIGNWPARLEFSRGFSNRAGGAESRAIGRKVRAIGRFPGNMQKSGWRTTKTAGKAANPGMLIAAD